MSKKVSDFPDQVLKVGLSQLELQALARLKILHGKKTNSGLMRKLLRDFAKREGIVGPKKTPRT
jgi:hypothetical protein